MHGGPRPTKLVQRCWCWWQRHFPTFPLSDFGPSLDQPMAGIFAHASAKACMRLTRFLPGSRLQLFASSQHSGEVTRYTGAAQRVCGVWGSSRSAGQTPTSSLLRLSMTTCISRVPYFLICLLVQRFCFFWASFPFVSEISVRTLSLLVCASSRTEKSS